LRTADLKVQHHPAFQGYHAENSMADLGEYDAVS
jgi:hypothetical protein